MINFFVFKTFCSTTTSIKLFFSSHIIYLPDLMLKDISSEVIIQIQKQQQKDKKLTKHEL